MKKLLGRGVLKEFRWTELHGPRTFFGGWKSVFVADWVEVL